MAIGKIERTVFYPHPIDKVWRAISTADALSTWLMETDFQAIVGSTFTFQTKPAPGFDGVVRGKVLVVDPPNRLVYSWRGGPLINSTVSFELQQVAGGTELTFEHSGFDSIRMLMPRVFLAFGWRNLLNNLLPAYIVGRGE
jgi:uncharacterized protein YndB with AHSA1/START domain